MAGRAGAHAPVPEVGEARASVRASDGGGRHGRAGAELRGSHPPSHTGPERVRAATALPSGALESLEALRIGGVDQWIFVRAVDPRAPVLLFVHGGPGSP